MPTLRRYALLVFFVVLAGGVLLQPGRRNPLPPVGASTPPAVVALAHEVTPLG